jgi:PhnB protein
MTDDLEALRGLRPDRLQPDDPIDPEVLARERDRFLSAIGEPVARNATPSIYPRLAYEDERAALEFLTRAFAFRERREARKEDPQGMLAWLEAGDGVVMIGRAGRQRHDLHSPRETGQTTTMVNVYVDDVDAHHARAVAEGARIAMDVEDMFWGDRRYEALDPEGHRWHFAQRTRAPVANPPEDMPRILPHVVYDDVGAAVGWLTEAFGFRERTAFRHTGPDGTLTRTQMQVADSVVTLGVPSVHGESPGRGVSTMLYVYVDDVDAHHRRAVAAGATIDLDLDDRPWGDRTYQASDPEGHHWVFGQHTRDVAPDVCD